MLRTALRWQPQQQTALGQRQGVLLQLVPLGRMVWRLHETLLTPALLPRRLRPGKHQEVCAYIIYIYIYIYYRIKRNLQATLRCLGMQHTSTMPLLFSACSGSNTCCQSILGTQKLSRTCTGLSTASAKHLCPHVHCFLEFHMLEMDVYTRNCRQRAAMHTVLLHHTHDSHPHTRTQTQTERAGGRERERERERKKMEMNKGTHQTNPAIYLCLQLHSTPFWHFMHFLHAFCSYHPNVENPARHAADGTSLAAAAADGVGAVAGGASFSWCRWGGWCGGSTKRF